jgi:hypothetical protein
MIVDYLIFNETKGQSMSDLTDQVEGLLANFVFKDVKNGDGSNSSYIIESISITSKEVNELTKYMQDFNGTYNLDKIAVLPEEKIRVGNVRVYNSSGTAFDYLFLLEKFNVSLTYINGLPPNGVRADPKEYTFLLIMPREVIESKILDVNNDVTADINSVFIFPFALFSLIMMFVISYFLKKISEQITMPIIELFMKI